MRFIRNKQTIQNTVSRSRPRNGRCWKMSAQSGSLKGLQEFQTDRSRNPLHSNYTKYSWRCLSSQHSHLRHAEITSKLKVDFTFCSKTIFSLQRTAFTPASISAIWQAHLNITKESYNASQWYDIDRQLLKLVLVIFFSQLSPSVLLSRMPETFALFLFPLRGEIMMENICWNTYLFSL